MHRYLVYSFIIIFFNLIISQEISINFKDNNFDQIDKIIKNPFLLEELTYKSDAPFEVEEFDYLTGLKIDPTTPEILHKDTNVSERLRKAGKIISAKDIKNALYYLKLKNRFEFATITFETTKQGKKLKFNLINYWRIKKVSIHGISFGKNNYKQKYVLDSGDIFDEQKHLHSIEKIKHVLNSDGFLNAKIIPKITRNKDDKSIVVDLEIKKGERFKINEVDFVINESEDDTKYLQEQIKKVYLYKFLKNNYVKKDISKKLKNIKSFLKYQNYPFADVQLKELINFSECTVQLRFELNLNQKVRLEFHGNKYFSNDQLADFILSLNYSILDLPQKIFEYELIQYYKKHDYKNVQVTINRRDFIFYFIIREGKKYKTEIEPILIKEDKNITTPLLEKIVPKEDNLKKFGKIVFKGNSKIPFKKLIKETDIYEGEIWQREKLQDTFAKLNDLQTFESINLNFSADEDMFLNKPVIIKLFSDDDNEFRFKAGLLQFCYDFNIMTLWSYKFGASLLTKNKFIEGDKAIFNSDFTRFYQKFVFSYKTPWFFDLPLKSSFQIYYNNYYQPLFYKIYRDNLYKINQQGFSAKFLKRDTNNYTFGLDCGLERQRITKLLPDGAKAIRFSNKLVDKFVPYFFIEPTLTLENVDNKLQPSKGYSVFLNLKMMQSFKYDNSFLKLRLEQAVYLPVFNSNVFAIRFRFGHIFIKDFELLLPSERLYLGGPTSLRSYQPDFSPPYGQIFRCKLEDNCPTCRFLVVPQGGSTMGNLNLELRMPVKQVKNLSFAIFNDLGTLINCFSEKNNPLLWALGFGIRYQTPIGPFRFDIGFRNRDRLSNSYFAWYLTLGEAF